MGGVTYHDGDKLAFWKQFLITLNGPVFGLLLGIIAIFLHRFPMFASETAQALLTRIIFVNIFWTLINLIPVLPLDGGQLLRIGLEKWFDFKGLRYTFFVSALFALLASLALFITQNFLAGAIFFLFAFENISNFRKSRNIREGDRKRRAKTCALKCRSSFSAGAQRRGPCCFQAVRTAAGEGILCDAATQYCALLLDEKGEGGQAYDLLKPLQERLDPPTLLLLHRLAFDHQDDATIATIGASVFQFYPLAEVALRNAYTAARQKKPEGAIGWLESAEQNGIENLKEIIQEPAFDPIRQDPSFQQLCNRFK